MKNIIVICFTLFLSQTAFAQNTPEAAPAQSVPMLKLSTRTSGTQQSVQFQVWGNCGMCKKTIEKAAKTVVGVKSASWNVETHQFNLVYNASKTSVEKVHQAIAAAGYDTDTVRGDDTAYNNLHGCCQYERRAQ